MKKISLLFTIILFGLAIVFISCEKEDQKDDENTLLTIPSAEDEALEDMLWNAIDADVDFAGAVMNAKGYKSVLDSCPMIILEHPDSAYFPRTLIIDYGESCETWYGRIKKGKIVISLSNALHLEGSVRTVTFEDFFIDEYQIEGLRTLTNNGYNDAGNMNFDVTLRDGKIIFPNQTEATREMDQNREWITGISTPFYWWDNEWLIRGNASGVHRSGKTYENTITKPILVQATCNFPVSGSVEMNINDLPSPVFLDYGAGDCDRFATLRYGDEEWKIELGH